MPSMTSIKELYIVLETELKNSTSSQQKVWAQLIIENQIDIKKLAPLLHSEKKTAMRFAWMLTEIAQIDPNYLFAELDYFFKLSKDITQFNFKESFANYWKITGLPEENESEAIDMLLHWASSPKTNITIKKRALRVLDQLKLKYPELENEISLVTLS